MELNLDYKEILNILKKYKVKYLIVGAYAVSFYTEPRFTKDLDIWIEPSIKNAQRLFSSLKEFGAPLKNITVSDFTKRDIIYQIGVVPIRIDIITRLPGVKFDKAWKSKKSTKYGDTLINIIGVEELIKSKKRIGRLQDKLDIKKFIQYKK